MNDLTRNLLLPGLTGAAIGLIVVSGLWFFAPDDGPSARPGYAAAVARAAPSVVNIYSQARLVPPMCTDERLAPWCERLQGRTRTSLGSGVIVHPDGYILTNAHVIEHADEILVLLADGRSASATLIGSDPGTDLAVVRVPFTGLSPIALGASDDVQVGDVALAIGNPFGIGQTVSAGIISAKGRAGVSRSPYDDLLQTDAAINPGNSGGALIDSDGRLIGINSLIVSGSGQSIGMGFAIPARLAYDVLEEIIETGRVVRGWIGITLDELPADPAGFRIVAVDGDGPADRSGLRPGDVITTINAMPARDPNLLSRVVGQTRPGEEIQLEILRGGRTFLLRVEAGARSDL